MRDDDELMTSLRTRVLDDEASLASLLRACLMLGKRTHADQLSTWAKQELQGYAEESELPQYRRISAPLYAKVQTGYVTTHQIVTKFHLPESLREYVPESVDLRQSIDEIEQMGSGEDGSTYTMSSNGMVLAAGMWTTAHGRAPFQAIESMYFQVSGAQLAGVVGAVRTALVEMVGDLTANLPMKTLPTKEQVNAAMINMYGDGDYNSVSVGGNAGQLNVGTGASQTVTNTAGVSTSEFIDAVAALRAELQAVPSGDERSDAEGALAELEEEVGSGRPDEGRIQRLGRNLVRALTPVASASVVEAAKALVPLAIAALAL